MVEESTKRTKRMFVDFDSGGVTRYGI